MSGQQIGWTVRGHERRMKEQAERLEAENQRLRDAATACLLEWAQGRGIPPRLTSTEVALRDALGLDMEIFGDEHRKLLAALAGTPSEDT
jgi:hypothetical protein